MLAIMEQDKRTLVYKRTHIDDPCEAGRFGCCNCMGERVRSRKYEAVIGIGGRCEEAKGHSIDGKITWVGIGPHKATDPATGFLIVTFDTFVLYNAKGEATPPNLSERMWAARHAMTFNDAEQAEIDAILDKARADAKKPMKLLQLDHPKEAPRRQKRCYSGRTR